jgi:hypothetical protein
MKTIKATSAIKKLIGLLILAKKYFKHEEIWWRGQRLCISAIDTTEICVICI